MSNLRGLDDLGGLYEATVSPGHTVVPSSARPTTTLLYSPLKPDLPSKQLYMPTGKTG